MDSLDGLVQRFEETRPRLKTIAYRMLGSLAEAEEAVQDAWLRLGKSEADEIQSLDGWLTTIVARLCLNRLRARRTRSEVHLPDPVLAPGEHADPEQHALLADSVGLALLLVLDTLDPAERLAFVLHDMFDVSFDEIARLVERTPTAARQLASRARRSVRGASPPEADRDVARQREVVNAFFAAARDGDFDALLAILHPDVVLRSEGTPTRPTASVVVRGAEQVARRASNFAKRPSTRHPLLVNGAAGVVVVVGGKPSSVLGFTVSGGVIVEINAFGDPKRLENLGLDFDALDD
jgi:RNA polymerase sigma factor (sigma-70 family)